ncbi:hypothetical protein WA026_008414 [Henosepilachna vigintioctopunctata]|uniref:Uncharacterized protein n=1 Tax=Henosepilachna vigintioctopunctata TaxID=420089 RepID=A0AAW1UFH8_9CUCU
MSSFLRIGLDVWKCVVRNVVGSGCLALHSEYTQPLCHLSGQIRGSYSTNKLSKYNVKAKSQSSHCWFMDPQLFDLLSTSDWMERQG